MLEYPARLVPVFLAAVCLTPASATTYTPGLDRATIADSQSGGASSDIAQAQTLGASYDSLTGTFAVAPTAANDADCGASDCDAAAAIPAAAVQTSTAQASVPSATPPAAHPTAAVAASATAAGAASNWYATALISDAYAYNGNNNAFLLDETTSFLPAMPDIYSWAMMFGGMIALAFLMRRVIPTSVPEPDPVEQAWGGPEMRAREMRAPSPVARAKVAVAIPALCCSRQALPGS